jgi:hypothetical protein
MNIAKMRSLRATGAVLCALITQATLASASADCKARYPAVITNCELLVGSGSNNTTVDKGEGSGVDRGGNTRRISVTFHRGTSGATAVLLSSNGAVACQVTTSTFDTPKPLDCNVAATPGTLELRVFVD